MRYFSEGVPPTTVALVLWRGKVALAKSDDGWASAYTMSEGSDCYFKRYLFKACQYDDYAWTTDLYSLLKGEYEARMEKLSPPGVARFLTGRVALTLSPVSYRKAAKDAFKKELTREELDEYR
jgi:hypothetical protein